MRSAVASPITVEGRLWGAIAVLSPRREPLPENTEARLADFTELVATAIANADCTCCNCATRRRAGRIAAGRDARRASVSARPTSSRPSAKRSSACSDYTRRPWT